MFVSVSDGGGNTFAVSSILVEERRFRPVHKLDRRPTPPVRLSNRVLPLVVNQNITTRLFSL